MSGEPTAKVVFRVPDHEGGASVETLWAAPIGNDYYKLDNSPFYAYGVSWQDTVWAPFDAREGMATFQSVVTRSGHRTIRRSAMSMRISSTWRRNGSQPIHRTNRVSRVRHEHCFKTDGLAAAAFPR